jgi:hypothetical protein
MGGSLRAVAVAFCAVAVACARGSDPIPPPPVTDGGGDVGGGGQDGGVDAGDPDGGTDGGLPDGGTDGGIDGGTQFGGPGPWPMRDVTYGSADGIQETPIVGMSTDEKQNLWVATHAAIYVMRPGETRFKRFDVRDGLHMAGNPVSYCDRGYARDPGDKSVPEPDRACPIFGEADGTGIQEIVGGGPNEVFVGYNGVHNWDDPNDGTWADPLRHHGQLDRVRLKLDDKGAVQGIQVDRLQMMAGNSPAFYHNRDVMRLVYDHFKHPHELFVGTNHGITRFTPDKFHEIPPQKDGNGNVLGPEYYPSLTYDWMSDHVHPQVCACGPCVGEEGLLLGDWRGLAIDNAGNLLVGGRWGAGKIVWVKENATPDNKGWFQRGGDLYATSQGGFAMGDPYFGGCGGSRPVWCVGREGDAISVSAVAVTPDGVNWFASGPYAYQSGQSCPRNSADKTGGDRDWGVASYNQKTFQFQYYSATSDIGLAETNVRDMVALPDGRLVLAGPNSGIVFWDPNPDLKARRPLKRMRAGSGLPSDRVYRLELDTMVDPPVLHVSTELGATSIRVLP